MSMPSRPGRVVATLALVCGVTLTSATAYGQSPVGASATGQSDTADLLEEFIHYITVAKPELAAGFGEQLVDSGVSPAALAELVDSGAIDLRRMERAFERGLRVDSIADLVESVSARIEQGRLDLARDRDRILEAIEMLDGTLRGKRLAERRLAAAGEYAVPYLLDSLISNTPELKKQAIRKVIESIGVRAISPLTVALPHIDPVHQKQLVEMLERIAGTGNNSYRHAAPALASLAQDDTTTQAVRDSARRAFQRIAGGNDSLSTLYTELSDMYMSEMSSLVAYPLDTTNNVWSWQAFGLVPTAVPTEIFNEVMAMKSAAVAVEEDPSNAEAIALYVAGDLRRENEMPAGGIDPVFGDKSYTPEFYATVFGTDVAQRVLGYALDSNDTPLVRDAVAALAKTTGGSNLFPDSARQPLVEALGFPDRRARLDAALTLARALPDQTYGGANDVVPVLASAVRTGGELFAAVVGDDTENVRTEAARLEGLGFTVVGQGRRASDILTAAGSVASLDLVVVTSAERADAMQITSSLRNSRVGRVAPVMIISSPVEAPKLRLEYRGDARTAVSAPVEDSAFEAGIEELLRRGSGGRLTGGEAERYAIESLIALRDIAISGSPAYDVQVSEGPLLDALEARSGGTRLLVADVLSLMRSQGAQRALFGAALDATDEGEQIDLMERVADSVKRFGNLSERRHVVALIDLVGNSEGDVAEAAARVHGALNLPTNDAVGLLDAGNG
ncbi:MAG: hypothetical protein AB8G96_09885 [Phycisphaerales bacterium]